MSVESAEFLYRCGGDEPIVCLVAMEPKEGNGEVNVDEEESASLDVSNEVGLIAETEETILEDDKKLKLITSHCCFHIFRIGNVRWMVCPCELSGPAFAVHLSGFRRCKGLL